MNHATHIDQCNVFNRYTVIDQQVHAGQPGGTGAATGDFDFFFVFARHANAIDKRRQHDNGGAVLVVVQHRNVELFAQLLFNVKALGRFNVFQVDAAEG